MVWDVSKLSCDGQNLAALHFKLGFGSFGLKLPNQQKIYFLANTRGHEKQQNLTCRKFGQNGLERVQTVLW